MLRQGGVDPLPLYRELCADPAAHPGGAAGLGECGDRVTDAEALWTLVEHPVPAVRLHAISGLRALDVVVRERLTPSLDDPSPAVVRAATRALLPEAAGIPEHLLRERSAPEGRARCGWRRTGCCGRRGGSGVRSPGTGDVLTGDAPAGARRWGRTSGAVRWAVRSRCGGASPPVAVRSGACADHW